MKKKKSDYNDPYRRTFVTSYTLDECIKRLRSWQDYPIDVTKFDVNSASFKIYGEKGNGREAFGTLERSPIDDTLIICQIEYTRKIGLLGGCSRAWLLIGLTVLFKVVLPFLAILLLFGAYVTKSIFITGLAVTIMVILAWAVGKSPLMGWIDNLNEDMSYWGKLLTGFVSRLTDLEDKQVHDLVYHSSTEKIELEQEEILRKQKHH